MNGCSAPILRTRLTASETPALFSERTKRAYELGRRQDPSLPKLPDDLFLLHTGGMDELVRECLRTSGATALPKLVDRAHAATLALLT